MATTYSTNSDLILDNGKFLTDYLPSGLTATQRQGTLDNARNKAYNMINAHPRLKNKTKIPATHIPVMIEVEVDMTIGLVLSAAYTQETRNISEWPQLYMGRSREMLDSLSFGATSEDAVAQSGNVGDGTVTITVADEFTLTETWTLNAISATDFSVYGSVTGLLPSLTVGTQYPEQDWVYGPSDYGIEGMYTKIPYAEFPIKLLVTAGSTPFEQDDKFLIKTWAASDHVSMSGLSIGRIVRA